MLTHHDSRGYEVAASDAARHARSIMEAKIAEGRVSATSIFQRINREVPHDRIAAARTLDFQPHDAGILVRVRGSEGMLVHRHALGQMATRAGVPSTYLHTLAAKGDDGKEEWMPELGAHILREHFRHEGGSRYLLRSLSGAFQREEVRGFMSDRYRRLDSRPLLEAFAGACDQVGAVPVDGTGSDTRVTMKAFLPMVFEPVPNEVLCLGVEWGNSDYGAARHTIRAMIWRLWCTNKATMEDSLAQVHLGGRLGDDIEFSDRTYRLDTEASISALNDTVKGVLGPTKVNTLLAAIRSAHAENVDWAKLKPTLLKKLLKGEMKTVEDAFLGDDVQNLPPGKTTWRASNALSWLAGATKDPDRKLELERVAGEILNGRKDKAEVAA
jgi:hypothetical protein